MKKKIYGVIYMIRNKINNKIYFGQTAQIRGFQDRYRHGDINCTHNKHLKKAIKKYGIENFEIIKQFDVAYSKQELDKLEDMYIKMYDTLNPKFGYNKRLVVSQRHSEETKRKLSEVRMGRFTGEDNPFYGKHHTEETRQKLSEIHKNNPIYKTDEFRSTMSEVTTGERNGMYGKHHSDETKKRISETKKGMNTKHIYQCDKNGNMIKEWTSIVEASAELGLKAPNITACLKGRQKTCGGYKWKYVDQ